MEKDGRIMKKVERGERKKEGEEYCKREERGK